MRNIGYYLSLKYNSSFPLEDAIQVLGNDAMNVFSRSISALFYVCYRRVLGTEL